MVLSKIRNAARTLLTLEEKDPKRMFEGEALMRRMYKYGLLNESQVRDAPAAVSLLLLSHRTDFTWRQQQCSASRPHLALFCNSSTLSTRSMLMLVSH